MTAYKCKHSQFAVSHNNSCTHANIWISYKATVYSNRVNLKNWGSPSPSPSSTPLLCIGCTFLHTEQLGYFLVLCNVLLQVDKCLTLLSGKDEFFMKFDRILRRCMTLWNV